MLLGVMRSVPHGKSAAFYHKHFKCHCKYRKQYQNNGSHYCK